MISEEMGRHCDSAKMGLKKVAKNQYVMARLWGIVQRAKIMECSEDSTSKAICFLPDLGYTVSIPLSDMTVMQQQFVQLPFQVF
jgi:hypothetical protein